MKQLIEWISNLRRQNKKCPFCGKARLVTVSDDEGQHSVMCLNCYAVGPVAESEQEAFKLWKKRS